MRNRSALFGLPVCLLALASGAAADELPAPARIVQINAYRSPGVFSVVVNGAPLNCGATNLHMDVTDNDAHKQRMAQTLYAAFFADKPVMVTYQCAPDASGTVRALVQSVRIP